MRDVVSVLSLCSGIGGLDLAVNLALGDSARTVAYVEREAYCCEVLEARMDDGDLDMAPIWSDLESFDGATFRGKVDIVVAGFPCQPVSQAGKRLVQEDERWLWPHIERVLSEVRPSYVFLENVPGLLVRGFGDVLGSLSRLGFDAEWGCVRASDLGAPHIRKRVFVLAYSEHWERRTRVDHGGWSKRPGAGDGSEALADADAPASPAVGVHGVFHGERPERGSDVDGRDLPIWPPGPTGGWDSIHEEFHPARPKSEFRRMANGVSSRLDELRAYGNGVVPVAAAHAFLTLAKRAGLMD